MKKIGNILRIILGLVIVFTNVGLLFFIITKAGTVDENPVSVMAQVALGLVILFPKFLYNGSNQVLKWVIPLLQIFALLWLGGHASLSGMGKDLFASGSSESSVSDVTAAAKALSAPENLEKLAKKQMEILHQTSQELNAKCPMKIDAQTQLDRTVAGPGLKFTYVYTVFGIDAYSKQLDEKLREYTRNFYSTNQNLRMSIEMGVTYCANYTNSKGVLLYNYCFDKANLTANSRQKVTGRRIAVSDLPLETMYKVPSVQKLEELSLRATEEPDKSIHFYNRGVYYMSNSEPQKAMMDFNHAIQLDKNNALAYAYRAHVILEQGEYQRAIEDCTHAIELTDFWGVFFYIRAKALLGSGEYDKAIGDLRTAAAKKYRPARNALEKFGLGV